MKWIRPSRQEWISAFVILPMLSFTLNYIMFADNLFRDTALIFYSVPIVFGIAISSWYCRTIIMHWLRIRFPHFAQTKVRLILLALTHVFVVAVAIFIIFYGYGVLDLFHYTFRFADFNNGILLTITITLLSTTFWEADYTMKEWKRSIAENQQLEQLAIKHEFETLKSQVNPHFLFNCFNTLSSLIGEDKKTAEKFLNELSKVYRYLLRSNENGLSTLDAELKFIQSYYELLHTRYGNALELRIEVDKKYEHYLLPSLSLQLLVENAVKHNVVSKSSPLVIEIFTTAGHKLIVNNNLQLKPVKAPSNKIGLENIRSKYKILNQPGFQVIEDKKGFCVVLPLLWSRETEMPYTTALPNAIKHTV
jgi:two-component system, LytTR family, sensor kinase